MRKMIRSFIFLFAMIPSIAMAQASGGQIVRKKQTQITETTTNAKKQKNKKENSTSNSNNQEKRNSKTKVINVSCQSIVTNTHKWDLSVIILSENKTILRKYVTPKSKKTKICSTRNEYIEDADTGQKYYILKSDIGFEPNDIEETKTTFFDETYPSLPQGVTKVNISTGSTFFVRNLKIR